MTTGAAPRAAETAERRRRLVAAAVELARDGGYEAVHMRDVAARADYAQCVCFSDPDGHTVCCFAIEEAWRGVQS